MTNHPSRKTHQPTSSKASSGATKNIIITIAVIIICIGILYGFLSRMINSTNSYSESSDFWQNFQQYETAHSEVNETERHRNVSPTKTVDACSNAPETRMAIGMRGRVTYRDNSALILRSSPEISKKTFIKNLAEGTRITVISGPVCSEGYIWWKIRTREGATGWSTEGTWREYYLEPFDWSD